MSHFPWSVLGIEETRDQGVIRKAYADALRALDIDKEVKAYAELRNARDEALWLASREVGEDDGDYGLGSLDDVGDAGDDPGFDLASVRFTETGAAQHHEGLDWSALGPDDTSTGEYGVPSAEPELSEGQERAREAWNGLLEILYPQGQYSDEGITFDQLDEGNRHLAMLIARADACDIVEHHALDHGLAQLLAETWPRSAPFVETAADAFHWLDESGQIEERPALMFLNLRLRGMRFHEKVQQADHPLHKAWVELSRPGRSNVIDRWRVKREQVYQLLTGIRERYPEIESYLDPQRVASWEYPSESAGGGGLPWWIAAVVIVGFIRIVSSFAEGNNSAPPQVHISDFPVGDMVASSDYGARLAAMFGEGVTIQDVRSADPIFATQADNARALEHRGSTTIEDFVRSQAYRSAEVGGFDELVALAELKRLWLGASLYSPNRCRAVIQGDFVAGDLDLTEDERRREAKLLRRLLESGVLSNLTGRGAGTFSIPGWAVEKTIARSGLTEAEVTSALQNPDDPRRCDVDFTLLGVVLDEPGRVSVDLLRGL